MDELDACLAAGATVRLAVDGTLERARPWDPLTPMAILPGAFNPVHRGHWGLSQQATEILKLPVGFEISVVNVDKPELPPVEVRRRLGQFAGRAQVWLTHAPRFVDKAELFPGAVFVIGADTALRIASARYYDGQPERMLAALDRLSELGCRFLVACRSDPAGRCQRLADVPVPAAYRELFSEVPPERFYLDVSSTELRAKEPRTK